MVKENTDSTSDPLGRRNFIYKLGIGTLAVVTGYFYLNSDTKKENYISPDHPSSKPILKKDIQIKNYEDGYLLRNKDIECYVNKTGSEIVNLLNGNNSINDIAFAVAKKIGFVQTEATNSEIACFISQLAEVGFLVSPFYTVIYEDYI